MCEYVCVRVWRAWYACAHLYLLPPRMESASACSSELTDSRGPLFPRRYNAFEASRAETGSRIVCTGSDRDNRGEMLVQCARYRYSTGVTLEMRLANKSVEN